MRGARNSRASAQFSTALQTDSRVTFDGSETRHDEMHSTIDEWLDDLATITDEAQASQQLQAWLDVQSRFHDYSRRSTLLIRLQRPEATRVAGYDAWQSEFDRHVQEGEQAIWIRAPIITTRCPEWVGFKPTAVFDVSQTEGEPLPESETEATGDSGVPYWRPLRQLTTSA